MIGAVFVVVFFAPIAFIYGRFRACGLKARHAMLKSRLVALLPMPLFFGTCGAIALVWAGEAASRASAERVGGTVESQLDTGNGVLDGLVTMARWLGQLELILFMVAIPYLMGAAIACALLILDAQGRIDLPPPAEPVDSQSDEG